MNSGDSQLRLTGGVNAMEEPLVPTVSVITPYYDGANYIGPTVESVRAQTWTCWEHVIVDDGSPDDVTIPLGPHLQDSRIRVYRQPNGGASRARNEGARLGSALSRYLLFLDQDDVLEPAMLETLVTYLENRPDVGMVFCDPLAIDGRGAPLLDQGSHRVRRFAPRGRWVAILPPGDAETPLESFLAWNPVCPSSTLLRRSIFEEVGGWDETLGQYMEDDDLWVRVALHSHAHYLPQALMRRRIHDAQFTRDVKFDSARRESMWLFEMKWSKCLGLTGDERERVEAARRFKDERLLPHLCFMQGREALRRCQPVEAAKQLRRGVRQLVRSRGRRWVERVRPSRANRVD